MPESHQERCQRVPGHRKVEDKDNDNRVSSVVTVDRIEEAKRRCRKDIHASRIRENHKRQVNDDE